MDKQQSGGGGIERSPSTHTREHVLALPEGEPQAFSLNAVAAPLLPPSDPARRVHAFTVDVEDWYQSCIDYDAPIKEQVVRNVDRLLAVLDECGVKGTFFVQGMVAEAFPALVSSLVSLGHEVQSHGYSHRPLFEMDAPALRDELTRAKQTVEDAAGTAVTAFRAQDFSILAGNLSAVEMLAATGFEIDSSIFPMRSRHYGIAKWPLVPHYLFGDGFRILEVPVAVWSFGSGRIPVAGGGYFRLFPPSLIRAGLRSITSDGRPAIVYCHPYEFNPDELATHTDVSRQIRLAQGAGRSRFAKRMRSLLTTFSFGTLADTLEAWGVR
jgi:polysaccharide deacetylase family protein (PEP-CTERM system associated)